MWSKVSGLLLGVVLMAAACAPIESPSNSGSQATAGGPAETAQGSDLLTPNGDSQEVVVHWQRSGGFAGICQEMNIYADGHAVVKDCGTDRVLASGELPEQERLELKSWLETYQQHSWKFVPPKGSADMFVDEYTISGIGKQAFPVQQEEAVNEALAGIAQALLQQPSK